MLSPADKVLSTMHYHAMELFYASLRPVDPYEAVRRFVRLDGNRVILGRQDHEIISLDLDAYDSVFLAGGGKAAAPMARAIEDLLGKRLKAGIIIVKHGFLEKLSFTEVIEADHPVPDQKGVDGTSRLLDLLRGAGEKDLIFSIISGGASALLSQPAGGITLQEKQAVTRRLLECGASINEINSIRKHISSSKGGQMARAAFPATTVNLMLSDVVGDRMDVIGSGPFVPDSSTYGDCLEILKKYEIEDLPESVDQHLSKGIKGLIPETPKQGEEIFERVYNFIIGSNILALVAAKEKAEELGYKTIILSSMIEGEAREVAHVHSGIAKEIIKTGLPVAPPACIISGGETTVTVRGKGMGGRNQEFCLAAAMDIHGLPARIVIMSAGTDGNDGPTDAAGAIVDPFTIMRGMEMGMDGMEYLLANDSYHYFDKVDGLIRSGPTNTNIMDVRFILVR